MKFALVLGMLCIGISLASAAPQAPAATGRPAPDPRSRGGGECRDSPYNCVDTPNPLPASETLWLEDMTWMDVRDAIRGGVTTVLIPTGGIEPSGPWLTLSKHNHVMRVNCPAIARKIGHALCAPVVNFVPEGSLEPPSGHMLTVGTISLRQETYEALLTDLATSFKIHGFDNIVFVGDSGGNQRGQKAVAERLNERWKGTPFVAHIGEYYDNPAVQKYLVDLGVMKGGAGRGQATWPGTDNLHDEPFYSLNIFADDPAGLRWSQRVAAGLATIDGLSLADRQRTEALAAKVVEFRVGMAVAAIQKALAARPPK